MTKDELKQFIAVTMEPEVKLMAEAELQKIEMQELAAQGDELNTALLVLKDVVDVFKANQPNVTGASISGEDASEFSLTSSIL